MNQQNVDMYLITKQKYFAPEAIPYIRQNLMQLNDSQLSALTFVELKDPTSFLIISILLGGWGIDRFMLGDIGMGVLKLLTGGLCGVLTIIDWFKIGDMTKAKNLALFMNAVSIYTASNPTQIYCPHCGQSTMSNIAFCPNCGKPIN